jgi:hypothetical protein
MLFKMVSLYTGFIFSCTGDNGSGASKIYCNWFSVLYRRPGALRFAQGSRTAETKSSPAWSHHESIFALRPSNGRNLLRLSQCRRPSPPPPPASPPTGPSMPSPATRAWTSPSSKVSDYTLKALHPLSSTPSFTLSPRLVNGIPQRWWPPRLSASRALPRPRGSAWRSVVFRRSLPSRPRAMPRQRRGCLGLRLPAPARICCWGSSERCVFCFSCNLT